jgi:hypothetical protein
MEKEKKQQQTPQNTQPFAPTKHKQAPKRPTFVQKPMKKVTGRGR